MTTAAIVKEVEESGLSRKVFSLAWPVVAEQTASTLIGAASTAMVGHLGAVALASVGLATQGMFIPQVVFAGVSVGATAVIARRIGEGNRREANDALHQSVLTAALVGVVFAPLMWFLAEAILTLLQGKPEVVASGGTYIRAAAPGLIPMLILYGANAALRGAGNTRMPMVTMLIANAVNVASGYVLIYGHLGLAPLGVAGAGLASSIGWLFGCVAGLVFIIRGVGPVRFDYRRAWTFNLPLVRRILDVGYPGAMEQLLQAVGSTGFIVIISSLGTVVYAAHVVALRIELFAIMPGMGLGMAAATLVGQGLGAGRPDLAERAAKLCNYYAIGLMSITGLLMGVFRIQLMSIFTSDRGVIEIGAIAIIVYSLSMPFYGVVGSLSGGLRGAGDTRSTLIITSAGYWLGRILLGYVFAHVLGFGAFGAWSAAFLDICVRGILLWWRFATGRWKAIKV